MAEFSRTVSPGEELEVKIFYSTNGNQRSTSWLTPEQTAGKVQPYLFTQCEDASCRSVAPMMDTPAIRVTYDAQVTAPDSVAVFMSANLTSVRHMTIDNYNVWDFSNTIPMPNYLIAIAVGDIVYKNIGNRTGVITEPVEIDRVANELDQLETFLDTAEDYLTPYIWGNYSILILPPSFPMGGMENPLLTFASPTIITGDKSQVDVAIHEIAHSWTGNEVTCQNWEHFWLNEGFTVFEERKVTARLHGKDFAKVSALLGNTSMYEDMLAFGLNHPWSSLHPTLKGDNPDDSFSTVPYEKGFQFLTYLESLVGEDLF